MTTARPGERDPRLIPATGASSKQGAHLSGFRPCVRGG
jgi:hypothetical protein